MGACRATEVRVKSCINLHLFTGICMVIFIIYNGIFFIYHIYTIYTMAFSSYIIFTSFTEQFILYLHSYLQAFLYIQVYLHTHTFSQAFIFTGQFILFTSGLKQIYICTHIMFHDLFTVVFYFIIYKRHISIYLQLNLHLYFCLLASKRRGSREASWEMGGVLQSQS